MKVHELIAVLRTYDPMCEVITPSVFRTDYVNSSVSWGPAEYTKLTSRAGKLTPLSPVEILSLTDEEGA